MPPRMNGVKPSEIASLGERFADTASHGTPMPKMMSCPTQNAGNARVNVRSWRISAMRPTA